MYPVNSSVDTDVPAHVQHALHVKLTTTVPIIVLCETITYSKDVWRKEVRAVGFNQQIWRGHVGVSERQVELALSLYRTKGSHGKGIVSTVV